jgi:hypothetical protein
MVYETYLSTLPGFSCENKGHFADTDLRPEYLQGNLAGPNHGRNPGRRITKEGFRSRPEGTPNELKGYPSEYFLV